MADNDQQMPEVELCFDNPKTIYACRQFLKINPLWFNYEGAFPLRYSFWSWHLPKQHCSWHWVPPPPPFSPPPPTPSSYGHTDALSDWQFYAHTLVPRHNHLALTAESARISYLPYKPDAPSFKCKSLTHYSCPVGEHPFEILNSQISGSLKPGSPNPAFQGEKHLG